MASAFCSKPGISDGEIVDKGVGNGVWDAVGAPAVKSMVGLGIGVGVLLGLGVSEGAAVWVIPALAVSAATVWIAGTSIVGVGWLTGWQAARNKAQRMKIS
jgi:hypothetical protein